MSLLRLLIERWFDRRFAAEAVRLAATVETEVGAFDPEGTAVHRVPLPDTPGFRIHFSGGGEARVRRTFLDLIGLGERMYLVDSAPMAGLAKPMGVLVYRGLSTRPVAAVWGMYHAFLNDKPLPLFNHDWLSAQVVHNPGAIPPVDMSGGMGQVQFSLPPLVGGFPRRRATGSSGGFQPPSGTDTLPPAPCPPVNAMFSLCFQDPLAPPGNAGRDHMWDDSHRVKDAFQSRDFRSHIYRAGHPGIQTFDDMMALFRQDLAAVPNLCQCPDDKVVIFIAAHGHKGDLQWQTGPNNSSLIPVDDFTAALAGTPEVAANPQKFVLIISSCHSGQFFQVELPGALAGAQLVTSTPDDSGPSYGGLPDWVCDALGDARVRTWDDFLSRLLWGWQHSGVHHPIPRTGWIEGCRRTATTTSIEYTGDDLGSSWSLEYLERTPKETEATTLTNGQTNNLSEVLFDRLSRPCDTTPLDTYVALQGKIQYDGQQRGGFQGKTVTLACKPGGQISDSFTFDVGGGQGKRAYLKINFTLNARCDPP